MAAVADFLYQNGANIIHADQHRDEDLFLMRVEWNLEGFGLSAEEFREKFGSLAEKFQMKWKMEESSRPHRAAIFCSKQDHCLADLLYRHRAGELPCEISFVVSNHEEPSRLAKFYDIPFHYVPVGKGAPFQAESQQLKLLKEHSIDLVVLARYMQILSPRFVAIYPQKIINVHHSFLPAFAGSKPYHQAFERGVKLIGATSHYVTEDLDQGPIIEQDVARVSHRDELDDLVQKGKDLEKRVLSSAVRWHIEHRILTYARKTVVFD